MTDNRTTELLPCPFCKGEAFVNARYEFRWCECRDCGAEGKTCLTEAEAIEAWNTRVTHGTLTAEQVREAIFNGSVYASYDGAQYYANGISMQAIADELNATLGNKTCEFRPLKDEDWSEPNAVRGVCSECSALMYGKDNYCPNCGKKVNI